jgi:hypothetical protein
MSVLKQMLRRVEAQESTAVADKGGGGESFVPFGGKRSIALDQRNEDESVAFYATPFGPATGRALRCRTFPVEGGPDVVVTDH